MLVESFDEVFNTPLTYNYNLAFEREIATGWMARAAYVGSTATQGRVEHHAEPGDLYARRASRAIPRRAGGSRNTAASTTSCRIGDSQYHSMQLTLNRRYANGFTVNANYTLADLQGTIGGPELAPYFHPDFDNIVDTLRYGRLGDMRRHRFVDVVGV